MINSFDELLSKLNNEKQIKFRAKINANSKADSIDFCDNLIRIRIKEPAIEGRANKAIIEYLSNITGVAKSKIKIVNGEKSALKTILIKL